MIEAYRKFVVFKSDKEEPNSGIVFSVGDEIKGISKGDTIYMFDYGCISLKNEKGYFAVSELHILAVERGDK